MPPDVTQFFIPIRGSANGVIYKPMVVGAAKVRFNDAATQIDTTQETIFLTPIVDQAVPVDWAAAQPAGFAINDMEKTPARGAQFGDLPGLATKAKNYSTWSRDFVTWLYGSQKLEVLQSPSTKLFANQGESERDFRIRIQQSARELRDQATDDLRKKYAPKIVALQEKVRKAQQAVDRESAQAQQAGIQTGPVGRVKFVGRIYGTQGECRQCQQSLDGFKGRRAHGWTGQ